MKRAWKIGALAVVLGVSAVTTHSQTSERIVVDGSTGVMPLATALARAYQQHHAGTAIELGRGLGTKARLDALAQGKIDIALASHGLDPDDLKRRAMTAHEIAKVAVVFGVNESVPAVDLTDRHVCDIYAGRVTSWKEVGGPALAIAPRTRPDSEVDTEVVRAKIACLKDLKMPDAVKVMPKSGDMAKELAATRGAVGMTTTTVVEQSRGKIRSLTLNGVAPTAENVETKTYALTRDSFFVTKAAPAAAVERFLAWVRSRAGADVIVANGAVPVK
ncbi:MAG: substrate-binding domain-containing protein [Candidatus Rokubacteria bacterium]|nr:substrate-binding domain-containing protein [Candidatus Rokubacteria bacterium]